MKIKSKNRKQIAAIRINSSESQATASFGENLFLKIELKYLFESFPLKFRYETVYSSLKNKF